MIICLNHNIETVKTFSSFQENPWDSGFLDEDHLEEPQVNELVEG